MSGNVNLTTKRGSNELHGSVFETEPRRTTLSARNFFVAGNPPLVYNQFGGSLGGPIIKDKLFAFGVYDGYRLRSFRSVVGSVPTPKFREEMLAAIPAPELKTYLGLFVSPLNHTPPLRTRGLSGGPERSSGGQPPLYSLGLELQRRHLCQRPLLAAATLTKNPPGPRG